MQINNNTFDFARQYLLLAIYGMIIASLAGFFFFMTGRANNFPTYFVGLLTLLYLALNTSELKVLRHSVLFVLTLIFGVYLASTSIWSPSATLSEILSSFANLALIITLLVGMVICSRRYPEFLLKLVYCLVFFASIPAAHFLIFNAISDTPNSAWGRLHSPSIASLVFGLAAVMAMWIVAREGSKWLKACSILASVILVLSCLVIDVNYVNFALLVAVSIVAGLSISQKPEKRWVYGFAAMFPIAVISLIVFDSQVLADRQAIWAPVLEVVFQSQSVFGHGILTNITPPIGCTYSGMAEASNCAFDHPHNIYVSTMYQAGIVGLVMLILLTILSVSMVMESRDKSLKTLVLACLAYGFIVLMFDGDTLIKKVDFLWLVFWLPIGMATVCEVMNQDRTHGEFRNSKEDLVVDQYD